MMDELMKGQTGKYRGEGWGREKGKGWGQRRERRGGRQNEERREPQKRTEKAVLPLSKFIIWLEGKEQE